MPLWLGLLGVFTKSPVFDVDGPSAMAMMRAPDF